MKYFPHFIACFSCFWGLSFCRTYLCGLYNLEFLLTLLIQPDSRDESVFGWGLSIITLQMQCFCVFTMCNFLPLVANISCLLLPSNLFSDPVPLFLTGLNCAFLNVICRLERFMRQKLQEGETESKDQKSSLTSHSSVFKEHKQPSAVVFIASKHAVWPLRWEAMKRSRLAGRTGGFGASRKLH